MCILIGVVLSHGNPQFYAIDETILTVVLTPNTSLVNGFWFYYTPMSTDMVNSGDFPFVGSASEIRRLRIFDEALEAYCRWKISPILNKDHKTKHKLFTNQHLMKHLNYGICVPIFSLRQNSVRQMFAKILFFLFIPTICFADIGGTQFRCHKRLL
jgi:hypothetical protein